MLARVVLMLMLGSFARAEPALAESALVDWSREPWGRSGVPVLAIAVDPASGEVAFGDERGASRARSGEPERRVARTARVNDLVYDRAGGLWIATTDGLWLQPVGQGAADRSPGPGEAARRVQCVATSGEAVAIASDAGVFASFGGSQWTRVDGAAPRAGAAAVALRCIRRGQCELWWLVGAAVWRAELEQASGVARVLAAREEVVSGAPAGVAPLDVLLGSSVADVVVLYPQAIALQAPRRSERGESGAKDWTVWRPVMPPGIEVRRIDAAVGRLWLSTDRGLLHARDPRLGWERAATPAGWAETAAAAGDGRRLFAATSTGVLRGALGQAAPSLSASPPPLIVRAPPPDPAAAPDPDVGRIHAMALAHLGLDPARQRELRERVARRSWWPELDVRVDYGGDRSVRRDFDQSFVSGDTRHLFDRDLERGDDWDAGITLRWDLAAAIFDPEVVDQAREERAWIALRDDVLDEINLLYYERRRVLLDLRSQPDPGTLDAERLRLRALELAAGLDAWTGGGFTRALASAHPDRLQE